MGKAETKPDPEKKGRPRNLYMDEYTRRYQDCYSLPYAITAGDATQLDKLLNKSGNLSERMTLEVWKRGVENYFLSELGSHTLKDLCTRFVAIWKQPLNKFGQPKEKASQVGGEKPAETFQSWHPKFLSAAWKIAQRDKRSLDAIEALFEEVSDLSEIEAFGKLGKIERGE